MDSLTSQNIHGHYISLYQFKKYIVSMLCNNLLIHFIITFISNNVIKLKSIIYNTVT